MVSQRNNKIQKSARLPAIILRKLQKARKILKNNLFEEAQTSELQGPSFEAWSQEERDVFSEKITTFGLDFTKISSFLVHKTPTDCIEYYSKHYKSECSTKANKCPPPMMQPQEKCKNVNDAAPYMSGIATATATKNYKRLKTVAEHMKKPANQICHELTAHFQSHSLPDKGQHVESSVEENEQVTGNVLVGEMNASSLLGMNSPITNSDQAGHLTELAELKNLIEDSFSNVDSATCIMQSHSKVKENVPQLVPSPDPSDGETYLADGASRQGTSKRSLSLPESCQKMPNGTIDGNQINSGKENPEPPCDIGGMQ